MISPLGSFESKNSMELTVSRTTKYLSVNMNNESVVVAIRSFVGQFGKSSSVEAHIFLTPSRLT